MSAPQDPGGGEFALIERHLTRLGAARDDVRLGPGDDAALLDPGGHPLAVAAASVEARAGQDPSGAARDCLARALAALPVHGATPAWATLALCLEHPDAAWLDAFAGALDRACREAGIRVVGGDTTSGGTAATLFVIALLDPADGAGPGAGDAPGPP